MINTTMLFAIAKDAVSKSKTMLCAVHAATKTRRLTEEKEKGDARGPKHNRHVIDHLRGPHAATKRAAVGISAPTAQIEHGCNHMVIVWIGKARRRCKGLATVLASGDGLNGDAEGWARR